jgi:hypothetical protein
MESLSGWGLIQSLSLLQDITGTKSYLEKLNVPFNNMVSAEGSAKFCKVKKRRKSFIDMLLCIFPNKHLGVHETTAFVVISSVIQIPF